MELEQQLEEVRRSHGADIEAASEEVRRQLEAEHLQKFSAVSKQIQTLQQSELDNLRTKLEEKHSVAISNLEARHSQEIINLKLSLQDVQDSSDKSQLVESSKHGNNMTNDNKKINPGQISEISPELYEAMKADIEKLEEEKYNMRSMQVLMRDLMKDLARHYDLSEKQVKFLSDSTFLDSFSLSLGVSRSQSCQ